MKHKSKAKVHDRFLEKMEKDVKELGKHKSKHHQTHKKHHAKHKKNHPSKNIPHKVHHMKHHPEHKIKHVKHHSINHEHKPEHKAGHKAEHHEKKHAHHAEHKKHKHRGENAAHQEHHIKHKKNHEMKHEMHQTKNPHVEHHEHKPENPKYVEKIEHHKKNHKSKKTNSKFKKVNLPTFNLKDEKDIAMDFATKVYQRFNKIIKSVVLFGSTAKQSNTSGSDIDVIIILDDATIKWDQELIEWYRNELEKIVKANPYNMELHINTIKLTTWWDDLLRGDPVVINIIRDGETLIDFGGFFEPLKYLLVNGKIKATPESIYSLLQRAPMHLLRSKASEIGAIEGLFWGMVDSSQAALIAIGVQPPSPEHIPAELKTHFVNSGKLKIKYVMWYRDLFLLHKKIVHREITDLKGIEIDDWQQRANEFLQVMAKLVDEAIST
ncbi:nucleotidyltransferase domain-containing protein [Candidatus Pacearchaeota archaeon]|nr:nucleotidyltransferase domain-containing protein [Candidatus Pacearchaeota archaeon]